MRSRWIGWSVVACVAATAAYAGAARRARSPGARTPTKIAARTAVPPQEAPAPALAPSPPPPSPPPSPSPPRSAEPERGPDDLALLSDDPQLARADRVNGDEIKGRVAFTFDDGPNPETTPHVLDALARYDVPATFFVVTRRLVGPLAEKNRALLGRLVDAGFVIASHSASHTNLTYLSTEAIGREIDQSLRVLSRQANRAIGLFRAPFGALDDRGREHLKKRGLTEVHWSIDAIDWRERDGDRMRERALSEILRLEGGVVLMHDAKEVTARSLALLLDDLEAANCRRLARKRDPILPVSLHYWLRDGGKPRPVPAEVEQRTRAYRDALPARCAARAKR